MLQSHPSPAPAHQLGQPAYRPSFRGPATTLTLPAIGADIPGRFSVHSKSDALLSVALTLADAGILREQHWGHGLRQAVADVFSQLADECLPKPLGTYTLLVVEDTIKANIEDDCSHGYHKHHWPNKMPKEMKGEWPKVSAVIVTFDQDSLVHRVIGQAIKRLEKERPGLGQTVLYWLHSAFSASARSMNPIDGKDWAGFNYWGGEEDESMRVEEELDYMREQHERHEDEEDEDALTGGVKMKMKVQRAPFDEEAAKAQLDIFTRADYDAAIPPEFGSKFSHRPKLNLKQLKRHRRGRNRAIIKAALVAAEILETNKLNIRNSNDVNLFENCRGEVSPYLLRWQCSDSRKTQDPLAQIYDDYMNDLMQSGEMLDVNAVFAWHDEKSLIGAVRRFKTFFRLLNAAENLLQALAPTEN